MHVAPVSKRGDFFFCERGSTASERAHNESERTWRASIAALASGLREDCNEAMEMDFVS